MRSNLSIVFLVVATVLQILNARGDAKIDQELSFFGPNIFWGTETNGVKSAICIEPVLITNGDSITCTPLLQNNLTNILWLYLPPMESRFQIELLDDNMHQVAKTSKGKRLGKPMTKPFRLSTGINYDAGYTGVPPLRSQTEFLSGSKFKLEDYFVITNPGKYHLIFQMKVIWFPRDWKGSSKSPNVPVVTLSPIDAFIEIKDR